MPETNAEKREKRNAAPFYAALDEALKARGHRLESLCDTSDAVERRVLEDYGAMFLSAPMVMPPPVCVFTSEDGIRLSAGRHENRLRRQLDLSRFDPFTVFCANRN